MSEASEQQYDFVVRPTLATLCEGSARFKHSFEDYNLLCGIPVSDHVLCQVCVEPTSATCLPMPTRRERFISLCMYSLFLTRPFFYKPQT